MPVSNLSLVERIARILAGRAVSANAEGDEASAGDSSTRSGATIGTTRCR